MNPKDRRNLLEAQGYMDLELPRPAVQSLERVAQASRNTFEWNELRARAHVALEEHTEALPYLYAAKDANPNAVPVFQQLAWCYKRTGQLTRAIDALRAADRICKRGLHTELHPLVMYNLSCYFSLAQRKSEMLHWLERAIAADSRFRSHLTSEPDFDPFRRDGDFLALAAVAEL